MISALGKIDSIVLVEPPNDPPTPEDATVVVNVDEPNDGTLTLKLYPATVTGAGLNVGPCRVSVDQG